jgi:isoquinoline 1-oxidoreductase subunit beta
MVCRGIWPFPQWPVETRQTMSDDTDPPILATNLRRRRVLAAAAAAPLTGLCIGLARDALAATLVGGAPAHPAADVTELTAWVRIAPGSRDVTLIVSQAEIGQGISTTLPAVLADELGADWGSVKLETAPWAPAYRHPRYQWMFTGNSESVQSFYGHLRTMGAAAREMLVAAGAARWSVPAAECTTRSSEVLHVASGRRLHFADLAEEAASLPVPEKPTLRPDAELRLVGRSLPRVDIPDKVTGRAVFGIDVQRPGMLCAAVRTAPLIGSKLLGFDDREARAMPGVRAIVPVQNGVAVVAGRYWQAARALARITLRIEDTEAMAAADSAHIEAQYARALREGPFATPVQESAVEGVPASQAPTFSATYANPFAAHATMEPMNCVADVTVDRCRVWAPTQGQDLAAAALQYALGIPPERIEVHRSPQIGGGFGRRLLPDFVVQAAFISRAAGAPVKVIWDREEDMRRDAFRPASALQLQSTLDVRGGPTSLDIRLVSPTILSPVFPPMAKTIDETGVDPSAMEGLEHLPYRFASRRVQFHLARLPIPTSVLRTTGYGPNLFAVEGFMDELARRAGTDPFAMRRRLLAHRPDALRLLDRLAVLSGWGKPVPTGRGRGLAMAEAFGSLIGMVAEVSLRGTAVKVHRVWAVVDCGRTLDPGISAAGVEGGIVFGLAFCKTEVHFERGRVLQDNLNTYSLPTLADTPEMAIEFLRSERPLGGVGEIGPITVPPALANAIAAAGGPRVRSMPLARHGLHFA